MDTGRVVGSLRLVIEQLQGQVAARHAARRMSHDGHMSQVQGLQQALHDNVALRDKHGASFDEAVRVQLQLKHTAPRSAA